jgi:hypothetical protein
MSFAGKWMELVIIMLSILVSQTMTTVMVFFHMWKPGKKKGHENERGIRENWREREKG